LWPFINRRIENLSKAEACGRLSTEV
jgi:hypothetical protein